MKQLLEANWRQIAPDERIGVRKYCTQYLRSQELIRTKDPNVVKMIVLLLTKITKLSWFDDPEVKNCIVPDLNFILNSPDPSHRLVGL